MDDSYENIIEPKIREVLKQHGIYDDTNSSNVKSYIEFDDALLLLTCYDHTETFIEDFFYVLDIPLRKRLKRKLSKS